MKSGLISMVFGAALAVTGCGDDSATADPDAGTSTDTSSDSAATDDDFDPSGDVTSTSDTSATGDTSGTGDTSATGDTSGTGTGTTDDTGDTGDTGDTTDTGTEDTSDTGSATDDDPDPTEDPPECTTDADCKDVQTTDCEVVTCDTAAGECVVGAVADGTACSTDSACVTDQSCQAGECEGKDVSCDDGDDCTEDSCHPAAGCKSEPIPGCCETQCAAKQCGDDGCGGSCGECGDGLTCTADGQCECVASCGGGDAGPVKVCGDDGCGGSCGECEGDDVCTPKGKCVTVGCTPDCTGGGGAGLPKSCGDDGCGGSCGECEATGQCTAPICEDGACAATDAENGTGCDDGESCTTADTCTDGVCGGLPATDSYEPNDTWVGTHLTDISDCDSVGYELNASLYGAGDIDWYWYFVDDDFGCNVEPLVSLEPPPGVDLVLCVYFTCNNGSSASLSCGDATPTEGVDGISGCCSATPGDATGTIKLSSVSCGTFANDSGFVDIEVQGAATSCADYTLAWSDD